MLPLLTACTFGENFILNQDNFDVRTARHKLGVKMFTLNCM